MKNKWNFLILFLQTFGNLKYFQNEMLKNKKIKSRQK